MEFCLVRNTLNTRTSREASGKLDKEIDYKNWFQKGRFLKNSFKYFYKDSLPKNDF